MLNAMGCLEEVWFHRKRRRMQHQHKAQIDAICCRDCVTAHSTGAASGASSETDGNAEKSSFTNASANLVRKPSAMLNISSGCAASFFSISGSPVSSSGMVLKPWMASENEMLPSCTNTVSAVASLALELKESIDGHIR
jgi:hypothetical protein